MSIGVPHVIVHEHATGTNRRLRDCQEPLMYRMPLRFMVALGTAGPPPPEGAKSQVAGWRVESRHLTAHLNRYDFVSNIRRVDGLWCTKERGAKRPEHSNEMLNQTNDAMVPAGMVAIGHPHRDAMVENLE